MLYFWLVRSAYHQPERIISCFCFLNRHFSDFKIREIEFLKKGFTKPIRFKIQGMVDGSRLSRMVSFPLEFINDLPVLHLLLFFIVWIQYFEVIAPFLIINSFY